MNLNCTNQKCLRVLFPALLFCCFSVIASPQGLGQFESAMETEGNSFKSIAQIILDAIFALGAIGVIYAYVTKRQDARDYLISYAIAIVVYGIIRQTYLTAT